MKDYKKYINALRKCAKEHENDITSFAHIRVSDLCRDTANLLEELEQEPKAGHWVKVTNGRGGHECDLCHEYAPSYQSGKEHLTNYCPNCGAKMIEPQERSDKE